MTARVWNFQSRGGFGDQSSEVLVERLFARIGEVSSLPAAAIRIMEVADIIAMVQGV